MPKRQQYGNRSIYDYEALLKTRNPPTAFVKVGGKAFIKYIPAIPYYPVIAKGGLYPLTYSVSPSLPNGLLLSSSNGMLYGTPLATSTASEYTITITDSGGRSDSANTIILVSSGVIYSPTFTENIKNYNLKNAAIAGATNGLVTGWNGFDVIDILLSIDNGVYCYSDNTQIYAFDTDTGYPSGSTIFIVNNSGSIVGHGGAGGKGGGGNVLSPGQSGEQGGRAIKASTPINLKNNGLIAGGGGGGGGGAGHQGSIQYGGGGGGGGEGLGSGARGGNNSNDGYLTVQTGQDGTLVGPGSGGYNVDANGNNTYVWAGGRGGYYGQYGLNGSNGNFSVDSGYGYGGPPGDAIYGSNFITLTGTGTVIGNQTINSDLILSISSGLNRIARNVACTPFKPITPSGGLAPYKFEITNRSLPTGLTLNSSTGFISGTPTSYGGPFTYTMKVTDSYGATLSTNFQIVVGLSQVTITVDPTIKNFVQGLAITPWTPVLYSSGGQTPVTYSVSPALPDGLTLNTSTGYISGTPTALINGVPGDLDTNVWLISVTDSGSTVGADTQTVIGGFLMSVVRSTTPISLTFNISSNQADFNLATYAFANGWNGIQPLLATVNISAGVYFYATTTSGYGFNTGTLPAGSTVTIVNSGYIMGKGGNGGTGIGNFNAYYGLTGVAAGDNGGAAISTNLDITIDNQSGYIGGGGGGGGSGLISYTYQNPTDQAFFPGGGGAGGGNGERGWASGGGSGFTPVPYITVLAGGTGGGPGQVGGTGQFVTGYRGGLWYPASAGGGGRIIPGTGGAQGTAYENVATIPYSGGGTSGAGGGAGGAGGGYAIYNLTGWHGAYGGAGGSAGNAGSDAAEYPLNGSYYLNHAGGGGGGWGAAGGRAKANYATSTGYTTYESVGGAGGAAVLLNNHNITWVGGSASYSRVYGSILDPTISVSAPVTSFSLIYNEVITPFTPVTASGGTAPIVYSTSGLPTGLSLNSSTGEITGTPTVLGSGSYTITASEAGGYYAVATISITVVQQFNFTATISSSTQNYNVRTAALAAGWDGVLKLAATITINSGVYVWSDSTASPAFTSGTLPTGSTITIINNGYIMGKGGLGGGYPTESGAGGGVAINTLCNITVNNTSGYIGGGGGGGGGNSSNQGGVVYHAGGGGAGGGQGGTAYYVGATGAGGAGGGIGASGSTGVLVSSINGSGGGGGRIMPGTNTTGPPTVGGGWYAGYGGTGGGTGTAGVNGYGGNGGTGGGGGNSGGNGQGELGTGGGGGWGASGGSSASYSLTYTGTPVLGSGGAGGKAIALNGYTCTLTNPGSTVYGAVA